MDPKTDVSSGRVRKRGDCDCSDDSIESSPPRLGFVAKPRANCNNNCKEPHAVPGGKPLRDVLSITIRPSVSFKGSTVRIYGAIRVNDGANYGFGDYLFNREKTKFLQVEVSAGQTITLPLQDPLKLSFFDDDLAEMTFIFMLMFDDETIFNEDRFRPMLMKSSFLFANDNMEMVGCGSYYLGRYNPTYLPYGQVDSIKLPLRIENEGKIVSKKVKSVNVNMVFMRFGMLAYLKFKTLKGGKFYGKITARLCLLPESESIVLFEKKEAEAVLVDRNNPIPFSRSLVAVGCGSSLVINVQLQDAFDHGNTVLHGTVHFGVRDFFPNTKLQGSYSELIQMFISWTESLYEAEEHLQKMDMNMLVNYPG